MPELTTGSATELVIAAAQTVAIAGDMTANQAGHAQMMALAARHGVQLLVFPELSLTGYELSLAAGMGVRPDHALLQSLHHQASALGMLVVVGTPLLLADSDACAIGAVVLGGADGPQAYAKQHLYGAEQQLFTAGPSGMVCTLGDTRIALAICADTSHAEHAAAAAAAQAGLYVAGVLLSHKGYEAKAQRLADYSLQHGFGVLMANYGGATGGWDPAGRSGFWFDGKLVVAAAGAGACLVIARRDQDGWSGSVVTH